MTHDEHWIGDLGHLALADASLGAQLIDMLGMLAEAAYPTAPREINLGMTTLHAAKQIRQVHDREPGLFAPSADVWLTHVAEVTEQRNRLLHALAINRCNTCGHASTFIHPRSGNNVDRSETSIHDLTFRTLALIEEGQTEADAIASHVNQKIIDQAKHDANRNNDIQNPPQVSPHHATHQCGNCAGGTGTTIVRSGTAVEIYPSKTS